METRNDVATLSSQAAKIASLGGGPDDGRVKYLDAC